MNYEKAYKDALERARNIRFGNPNSATANVVCEQLFPELKMSEDERIRKEIIDYIQEAIDTDGRHPNIWTVSNAKKWLEWLEKQGENHIVDKNEIVEPTNKIKPKFDSSDWIIPDMSDETVKPTYNVEPKFKIGDWVVFNNQHDSVYQIKKIENYEYTLRHILGGSMPLSFSHEDMIREWTIKDANNGDVLITIDDKCPFIYKGCLDSKHPNFPVAYCGLDSKGCFCHNGDEFNKWWVDEEVQPATKEQYDLLFSKMKEAGYEWDADKKELKKIN